MFKHLEQYISLMKKAIIVTRIQFFILYIYIPLICSYGPIRVFNNTLLVQDPYPKYQATMS